MDIEELRELFACGVISKSDFITKSFREYLLLFQYQKLLKSTDIDEILIRQDRISVRTRKRGISLFCDLQDERFIPYEILNFNDYENDEYYVMERIISLLWQEGFVALDVGANIGWYTLNMCKAFRGIEVHSFEPIPKTYSYLCQHVALNNVNSVVLNNFGLSDCDGFVPFYYYPEGSGNASLVDLTSTPSVQKIDSKVQKMDTYVQEKGIKVDFIKCDVEGAELMVFKGGQKTLEKYRPVIFSEMLRKWAKKFDYHPNDIIDLLKKLEYDCYVFESKAGLKKIKNVDEETTQTNFVFIPMEKKWLIPRI